MAKPPIVLGLAIGLAAYAGSARAQDAAAGEVAFRACRACHAVGEGAHDEVGPVLNGIVGRAAGSYPDYSYSEANKSSGLTWDEPTLTRYLKHPQSVVPGTKMSFAGVARDRDIANIIAYLKQFGPDGKKR
jgi:cytochrome c